MNSIIKEQTIKRYTDLGIPREKIHFSEHPNVAFDVTENKLVGNTNTKGYHVYVDEFGKKYLTFTGIPTSLTLYSEINEDLKQTLLNAENIIVTVSHKDYYKFTIAPTKEKLTYKTSI